MIFNLLHTPLLAPPRVGELPSRRLFCARASANAFARKSMRKAVKQAPVVQSVAPAPGGGSRALITVTRQIQEVRQEFDRMLAAKEPLWFSMPEPVDHNPLHFRSPSNLSSVEYRTSLTPLQVFVERVRAAAAAELLGGRQIRGACHLLNAV